jgi:hypothetical protein
MPSASGIVQFSRDSSLLTLCIVLLLLLLFINDYDSVNNSKYILFADDLMIYHMSNIRKVDDCMSMMLFWAVMAM